MILLSIHTMWCISSVLNTHLSPYDSVKRRRMPRNKVDLPQRHPQVTTLLTMCSLHDHSPLHHHHNHQRSQLSNQPAIMTRKPWLGIAMKNGTGYLCTNTRRRCQKQRTVRHHLPPHHLWPGFKLRWLTMINNRPHIWKTPWKHSPWMVNQQMSLQVRGACHRKVGLVAVWVPSCSKDRWVGEFRCPRLRLHNPFYRSAAVSASKCCINRSEMGWCWIHVWVMCEVFFYK